MEILLQNFFATPKNKWVRLAIIRKSGGKNGSYLTAYFLGQFEDVTFFFVAFNFVLPGEVKPSRSINPF